MLKKYCTACYWRVKRASERECGMPGAARARQGAPMPRVRVVRVALVGAQKMPSKNRFIQLYRASPRCAITGRAFDAATDLEQLLRTPVRRELTRGYEERNLVFVARVVGNSMRNGHASFAQCAEAFGVLAAGRALSLGSGREQICAPP
jgi:hypothetical protein